MRPRRAGIYLRISLDRDGTRLGVTRQRKDCETKAADRGWDIAHVYEDNDVSASTGRKRPAYERMLADIEHGTIDAVIVWDLDRLTRRPIEIEQFIDLADRTGCALASVGGDVDLATDNGRLYARIKGAVARAEVERKSTRMKAANVQRAEAGHPPAGGTRMFGYDDTGTTTIAGEAEALRWAAHQILTGRTVRGVTRDLNTQGHTTTRGGPWHPLELRRILINPRLAGHRVYRGDVVAAGTWPAILTDDTHHALRAVLDDPARRAAGPPRRYLLSGIATCSLCGGPLYGASDKPKGYLYRCFPSGHIARRAEPVEEYVTAVLLARAGAGDLEPPPAAAAEPADDEAELRARLNGLSEAFAAGDIDRLQLQAGTRRLRARLDAAAAARGASAASSPTAPLLEAGDPPAVWAAMPLDVQRAVVAAVFDVVVHPPGRGARTFNPDTVTITRRCGTAG